MHGSRIDEKAIRTSHGSTAESIFLDELPGAENLLSRRSAGFAINRPELAKIKKAD